MKILETSNRNVANTDQLADWLDMHFNVAGLSDQALDWVQKQVKKWVLKEGEVRPFDTSKTIKGMPDWLRQSIAEGKPLDEVVLDDQLRTRIAPVIDYMEDRIAQDPKFDASRIGFAAAEVKSQEWHKRLADAAKKVKPTLLIEPGALVIKAYDDGYTWRELTTEDALNREGELMGHCVGTHGYIRTVIRGGGTIISLRDEKNEPHVTIHLKDNRKIVSQIKGKANLAVIDKYLDYVFDYLVSGEFKNLRYLDGATALEGRLRDYYAKNLKPMFVYKDFDVVVTPLESSESASILNVVERSSGDPVGRFKLVNDKWLDAGVGSIPEVIVPVGIALATASNYRLVRGLAYMAVREMRKTTPLVKLTRLTSDRDTALLKLGSLTYTAASSVLIPPLVDDSLTVLAVVSADKRVMEVLSVELPSSRGADITSVFNSLGKLLIDELGVDVCRVLTVTGSSFGSAESIEDIDIQKAWVKAVNRVALKMAADSLNTKDGVDEGGGGGNPVALIDALATTLKQPSAADVKRAYLALKNDTVIEDSDFKRHGFSLGGRAVNMLIPVLMCTLSIKNSAPFRKWVYTKPNAIKCLTEVLHTPDFIGRSLIQLGLTEAQVETLLAVLRNEFLRLVPTLEELDSYELELDAYNHVAVLRKRCSSMRQNPARSKAIWGTM